MVPADWELYNILGVTQTAFYRSKNEVAFSHSTGADITFTGCTNTFRTWVPVKFYIQRGSVTGMLELTPTQYWAYASERSPSIQGSGEDETSERPRLAATS